MRPSAASFRDSSRPYEKENEMSHDFLRDVGLGLSVATYR
jgi:hypothetical protein